MTVKECYEKVGANYADVLKRLGSEQMVTRFALKFLTDPTFGELVAAYDKKDAESAFRAAHTLKGICSTLGFTGLFQASYDLTEKLRGRDFAGTEEDYALVSARYEELTSALKLADR